ncbi:MAG: phage tail tape measure protein [Planctomycetota bacterium]
MPSATAIRAGAAYIELYTHDSRLVRGLARASKRLKAFGASVSTMGFKIAAAGTAMMAPLLGAAKLFASTGDQLEKMRARTGLTAKALSELGFAAEQGGASIDQLDRSLAAMARFSVMVERGLKTSTDLLDMLGVSVDQFKNASPEERFKLLAESLSQVADETLRAGIALNVFGRSGRELLPMLEGGRASIEALQEEARRLGITLSDDDADAAAELTDAMNRLRRQLKAIVVQIGAALAPVLTELQQNIAPLISQIIDWVKENRILVVTIFKIAAAVVAAGVGLIVLGGLIVGFGAMIGGLVTVIGAVGTAIALLGKMVALLLSPIGLVILAVVALGAFLVHVTGVGAKALGWLGEKFDVLKSDAITAWKGIGDALAAGDLALAAKILWLSLKMEWKRGIHFLNGLWLKFKESFQSIATDMTFGAALVFNDAWSGLEVAWTETVDFLADAWSMFTNLLTRTWHSTVGFIKKAWVRLKSLFDEDVDVNAEVERINRETSEANQTADDQMLEAVGRRDRERKQRREQIENDRSAVEDELIQMYMDENDRREKKFTQDLAGTESELADAKREWQEAIAQAAEQNAESSTDEPDRIKDLQESLSLTANSIGEEQQKVEVKGTFNALAARGLSADSLAERTARASEQIVVNTKDLVNQAKQGKLVFGR